VLVEPGADESVSAACAHAQLEYIDARLVRAVRRCEAATPVSGDAHPSRMKPILKFGVVKLVQYDLVLFADSDVTLVPEGGLARAAARWAAVAPAWVNASWPQLIAHADSMSPVSGAVFAIKPSLVRYADGLRVLHRCSFNSSHGWDRVGPPSLLRLRFAHADGEPVTQDTGDPPRRTDAYRRDNWAFVGADSDQGFLFYAPRPRHEPPTAHSRRPQSQRAACSCRRYPWPLRA
jgi:hypothetical protein